MSRFRLAFLLLLLGAVVIWAWLNDRVTPADPRGIFRAAIFDALVLVALVAAVWGLVTGFRKSSSAGTRNHPESQPNEQSPGSGDDQQEPPNR